MDNDRPIKQIRLELRKINLELGEARNILRAKEQELEPLKTQIGLMVKQQARINNELISALTQKLGEEN